VGVQRFRAVLRKGDGGGHLLEVPLDVRAVFGEGRPPVRGTVNGTAFRTRVAVYGGKSYLGFNREIRDAAGIGDGDEVEIELERDDAPREIDVPAAFSEALETGGVRDEFDALSCTHRKEYVRWIDEAKRNETRERRLAKAVEMLRDGIKTPG
jgi:bifunctional DNA-binding transcriptional regulator/antitoxin component of YhaV-PrlF toxin-antitoxin module